MTRTAKIAAPTLRERGESSALWPSDDGPWHHLTGNPDQMAAHGAAWCSSAWAHPDWQDQDPYPQADHDYANECRTTGGAHWTSVDDLAGHENWLQIYAATPFDFGEPRDQSRDHRIVRVVFDVSDMDDDTPNERRVSVTLGDALLIAQHIDRTVAAVMEARHK